MPPTTDPQNSRHGTGHNVPTRYVGRFAPSPTGQLHFGSLVAAVASFADARSHNGFWLLRNDDVDQSRTVVGSAQDIMATLRAFGFSWDGPVHHQSQRQNHYADAIDKLRQRDLVYPCRCSRRQVEAAGRRGADGIIYPGTCLNWNGIGTERVSVRLRTSDQQIRINDQICGCVHQNLARECGDFVIQRADGFTAYQLAVVVDDFIDGITHVVRGADLLSSTPRQVFLQQQLNYPNPVYAHIPLARDHDGNKLSKYDDAHPVNPAQPLGALHMAWEFLGQPPLPNPCDNVDQFWMMAIPAWSIKRIEQFKSLPD